MMRKLIPVMLLISVLLSLVRVVPASAQSQNGNYIPIGRVPVPEGEVVQVTYRDSCGISLKWEERVQDGFSRHSYDLQIQSTCVVCDNDSNDTCNTGRVRILKWVDLQDDSGRFHPDGKADLLLITPFYFESRRELTSNKLEDLPLFVGDVLEIHRWDTLKPGFIQACKTTAGEADCFDMPEDWIYFGEFDPEYPMQFPETSPAHGEIAVIKNFWVGYSGVTIYLHQMRDWTEFDLDVLQAKREFEAELKANGLALLETHADVAISYYQIDNQRAIPGLWGNTFEVRDSFVQAFHETPDLWEGWNAEGVMPGAYVRNGDKMMVSQMSPEEFLWLIGQASYPQWQPEHELRDENGIIWLPSRYDTRTFAVLARLGFALLGGKEDFSFYQAQVDIRLPAHTRKVASALIIERNTEAYWAQKFIVDYCGDDCWQPAGRLYWGDPREGSQYYRVDFGRPILAVFYDQDLAVFNWQANQAYELVRSGWREVTLHKIVWTK